MSASISRLEPGVEIVAEPYLLDEAAAHAYAAGIEMPARRRPRPSIHSDPEAARKAGFKAPIAAGEQSYALVANLLVDRFGVDFLRGGKLEAVFVKPVYFGERLTVHARISSVTQSAAEVDVWVDNDRDERVLVGKAQVPLISRESP